MTTASTTNISPRKIRVIGVPLDLGQSRRGVDMGPSAVRVAGLEARLEKLGHEVEDGGNVEAVAIPEQKKEGDPHAKYVERDYSHLHQTCGTRGQDPGSGKSSAGLGRRPLDGEAGLVSGVAEFYRRHKEHIGLIWIDAHTDIQHSGKLRPVAACMACRWRHCLGLGPPELSNIFLIFLPR